MRLRLGMLVLAASVGWGCDNGPGDGHDAGGVRDSGMHTMVDSGHQVVDSSTPHDSGSTMTDGGGGGRCGPVGGECDINDPSSCGAGMACYLNGDGAGGVTTECFPAGTGLDGTACTAGTAGDCAEGFGCSQDESLCRRWCCSNSDCNVDGANPPGQLCNQQAGAGPDDHHLAGICVHPDGCDVVDQSGCDAGEVCNTFALQTTICDSPTAAAHAEGEACEARNDCVGGLGCVGDPETGEYACRKYCHVSDAATCPDGFTCGPLMDSPEDVGVCNPMS